MLWCNLPILRLLKRIGKLKTYIQIRTHRNNFTQRGPYHVPHFPPWSESIVARSKNTEAATDRIEWVSRKKKKERNVRGASSHEQNHTIIPAEERGRGNEPASSLQDLRVINSKKRMARVPWKVKKTTPPQNVC